MKPLFGAPGPGGSLGQCGLCGEPFLAEILLGEPPIRTFDIDGCDQRFVAHNKCVEKYAAELDVKKLPTKSPLRQVYDRQQQALGIPS